MFAALLVTLSLQAFTQEARKLPGDLLCDDDLLICRESCSMELGTRATNREKVAKCAYRCEQTHTVCLQRNIAKRQAAPRAPEAPEKKKPAEKEEYFSGAPTRFSQQENPAPPPPEEVEEVAPVRRTVTRSSELEAAPDNSPSAYPDREGFVTKGSVTKEDRAAASGEGEGATQPADDSEEPVVEQPKTKTKTKRPVTNELGY